MPVTITPRERRDLKARAHALDPVVQVGHGGVTDRLVSEIDRALTAHELIKVRIQSDDRDARHEGGDTIAAKTDAVVVGRVGKILILWRPRPDDEAVDDAG